ncbi:hypothetical protein [Bacillus sp. JCM 19034]|uniref:hypothetical protein n=1 Tax=Bacillus sp. JCM 19034 TaxID=1481928 RepID=UPI000783510D|nr:hypothetical protein [Bacillus sp. JCM 19034]
MSQKIQQLENEIKELQLKISVLENILISTVPEWAKDPLKKVGDKGEVPYPFLKTDTYGSYDYYRIIALLVRNQII